MECHLVIATREDHPPLCACPWEQRGLDRGEACGHVTEHRARRARARLGEAGVHVMVRRGPCPEAVRLDKAAAEREKRAVCVGCAGRGRLGYRRAGAERGAEVLDGAIRWGVREFAT